MSDPRQAGGLMQLQSGNVRRPRLSKADQNGGGIIGVQGQSLFYGALGPLTFFVRTVTHNRK